MHSRHGSMHRSLYKNSIHRKLIVPLVALMLIVFVFLAAFQYSEAKKRAEEEIRDKLVTASRLASLVYGNILWNYNYDGMSDVANAMMLDAEIGAVQIRTFSGREIFSRKEEGPEYKPEVMSRMEAPITYQDQPIGIVTVAVTTHFRQYGLQQSLIRTVIYLALMVAALVVIIGRVARSVTGPIAELESMTEEWSRGRFEKRSKIQSEDEVGRLAEKFNGMTANLSNLIKERDAITEELVAANEELRAARNQLELKVEERTSELMALNQELIAMNDELVSTLDRLKKTQQQLLHSEKMAALGSLVAGISHEISTPLGIGVTSVSYIQKELSELSKKFAEGTLQRADLQEFIEETMLFIQTTAKNLERADLLIRSFKQISVDQTTEDKRKFNVKAYLQELMISLNPLLKNTPHHVLVECPEELEITTYPGLLAQILTNFITNSLKHGFEKDAPGTIRIRMDQFGSLYTLTYSDDGKGMPTEVLEHIYEPFFTTKRGADGGTGLGLHLVYNIITQKLGGEIKCFSEPGQGISLIVTFPDLFSE